MRALPPANRLSRRRLLAASGATLAVGSSVVLAACGKSEDDEGSPEENAEKLNKVLAAQLAVQEAIRPAVESQVKGSLEPALQALSEETDKLIQDLTDAIEASDGSPTDAAVAGSEAESAIEGLRDQLNVAILTATEAVADISEPDAVATVYKAVFTDAANVSVLNDVLGEDPAPDAFVGVAGAEESS